ncbi:MAG: hypothetical protein QW393_04565 [Candidatus Micrarchaeaceae archaeon]
MESIDRIFLFTPLLVAITGIALLKMRSRAVMYAFQLMSLSFIGLLFISAPYRKFIHLAYRCVSIARYHQEKDH